MGDGSFRTIFGRAATVFFLRLFGDVAFLPHLILDNEGAGEPGAGCRKVPEDAGSRKGAGSPEAGSRKQPVTAKAEDHRLPRGRQNRPGYYAEQILYCGVRIPYDTGEEAELKDRLEFGGLLWVSCYGLSS